MGRRLRWCVTSSGSFVHPPEIRISYEIKITIINKVELG